MPPPKELDAKLMEKVGKFVADIRNGKVQDSEDIAMATLTCLEEIISESPTATAFELCGVVRAVGRHISNALPQELVAANMVRRVLRVIRDENRPNASQGGEGAGESLQRLVLAAVARRSTIGGAEQDLREPIRDQIAEIRAELEGSAASVCSWARDHIDSRDVVLTYGASRLAERCVRAAKRCVLVESTAVRESHAMALRLSNAGVDVTVVNSAAICAVMSRVNKVVICVKGALGGGAALAEAGVQAVTSAAKHHCVPVIVLTPLYQLSCLHGCLSPPHINSLELPNLALSYENSESADVHVFAPTFDFIMPDHITLFLTNLGGSSPSYIYRLISEIYDPKDYDLTN